MLIIARSHAVLIYRVRAHRQALPVWLDSVGQFEALLSLARYSYENPEHTFPVLRNSGAPALYAERLGHPMIPSGSCVRCDLELESHGTQLVMVSGSNMGGKSTLLRSVGVNSVLAFAGSVVRASHMELSPFHIACSIAIHDSLLEGKSRFQAEVERLRWIFAISIAGPALFLLDEVLGGTNSTDRFFGTEAIIKQLLDSGSLGLVTTHDLALTEVATSLGSRATNAHFEEQYEKGAMCFDYQLRPGVLASTNGRNVLAALGFINMPRLARP